MTKKWRYYHNPKCSKSRQGLELLQTKNIEFTVIEYLKEIPSEKEFLSLLKKFDPFEFKTNIRVKESAYKEQCLGQKEMSIEAWAKTLQKHPKLLERPILEGETSAIVGRPVEDLEKIL